MRNAIQLVFFVLLGSTINLLAATGSDTCSAKGTMEGEAFAVSHCVVARGSNNDVAIWFNEGEISWAEQNDYQASSYIEDHQRTLVTIEFCPGGGEAVASPEGVRSIALHTSNSKTREAGVRWTIQAPKDFTVEKMEGTLTSGKRLAGKIVSKRSKTELDLTFDLTLPEKESGSSLTCRK